jgi:hypothetical protein
MRKAKKGQATIRINPVPEYEVRHGSDHFVALMEDTGKEGRVFSISESYVVRDPALARILEDAAARAIRIEVEIEITAGGAKEIVATKIPAPKTP